MGGSIKSVRYLSLWLSVGLALTASSSPILIDQSLAVVDKKLVTLRDVQARIVAAAIEGGQVTFEGLHKDLRDIDVIQKHRQDAVDEVLIDGYFETGQLKAPRPSVYERVITPEAQNLMRAYDLSEAGVRRAQRLMVQKGVFVETFIALRANLRPGELEAMIQESPEVFKGKSKAELERLVRAKKVEEEYQQWRQTQVSRSQVLFLPLPGTL